MDLVCGKTKHFHDHVYFTECTLRDALAFTFHHTLLLTFFSPRIVATALPLTTHRDTVAPHHVERIV